MLTESQTENGRVQVERRLHETTEIPHEHPEEYAYRRLAVKQLERVRSFKLHLALFLIGMPVLTGVWALTEYMNADGWPDRFSDSAGPGNWNPWILWVVLIWGGLLAYEAVKTYLGGPPTEADIDREVERLKARR